MIIALADYGKTYAITDCINSIESNRNILRRKGRKIQGKGIGKHCLLEALNLILSWFSMRIVSLIKGIYMLPLSVVVND